MNEEYKTFSELDVQPGDVVESMAGSLNTIKTMTTDTVIDTYDIEWSKRNPIWRLVSRASDTPKPLRDMTDVEIGALVRAKNEGRAIEVADSSTGAWVSAPAPGWWPRAAYRVRPEPKREIERVTIVNADGVTIGIGTVVCEDGKPDCDSIKMEPL